MAGAVCIDGTIPGSSRGPGSGAGNKLDCPFDFDQGVERGLGEANRAARISATFRHEDAEYLNREPLITAAASGNRLQLEFLRRRADETELAVRGLCSGRRQEGKKARGIRLPRTLR